MDPIDFSPPRPRDASFVAEVERALRTSLTGRRVESSPKFDEFVSVVSHELEHAARDRAHFAAIMAQLYQGEVGHERHRAAKQIARELARLLSAMEGIELCCLTVPEGEADLTGMEQLETWRDMTLKVAEAPDWEWSSPQEAESVCDRGLRRCDR
jgi:hypothetical protein